jgi:hypothetical protein
MSLVQIYVSIAASIAVIASLTFAGIRHLVKSYLHELIPNGGRSIKDQMNRLDERIDQIYTILLEKK